MHEFSCTDAGDMNFELMAERTRYLKEHPEGVGQMCKVMEEMRKEEREEALKEGRNENMRTTALRMLADGTLPLEKIAEYAGLPLEEVRKLQAGQGACVEKAYSPCAGGHPGHPGHGYADYHKSLLTARLAPERSTFLV